MDLLRRQQRQAIAATALSRELADDLTLGHALLQKGFIISAGNLFLVVATVANTNYAIQKITYF
jgi:hypothetical protein